MDDLIEPKNRGASNGVDSWAVDAAATVNNVQEKAAGEAQGTLVGTAPAKPCPWELSAPQGLAATCTG